MKNAIQKKPKYQPPKLKTKAKWKPPKMNKDLGDENFDLEESKIKKTPKQKMAMKSKNRMSSYDTFEDNK